MTDFTNEPTHESEVKRLARECYDQILNAGATVASAVEGNFGGAIDFSQIKAGVNRALDAVADHLNPQVEQSESAAEASSSDPDAPVHATRWRERTIGIPRELVAQAINTLAQGMAGQLTASESQMAAATAVIDNIKYGPFVVDESEEARQKQINDAMARAIMQEKKAFEDRILKGTDAVVATGGGDYNYGVNTPWAPLTTVLGSGATGNPIPPAADDDDSEQYVERQKAEASRIAKLVANQPSWVPRAVGEARSFKCGHCLVEITRLPGFGDTGEYRVEVHGPKDPWGKDTIAAIGRTMHSQPYWASERLIWLTATVLLGEIAYTLYPER